MKDGILISEVAKRYGLSRPALIYYDTIGLLCPAHDTSTGYRYYSPKDMERLEMIITLRESGLPLKAIKRFMDKPSHRDGLLLLRKQREIIREKISELKRIEYLMDKRIHIFEEHERIELYKGIEVRHYDTVTFTGVALDYSRKSPMEDAVSSLKSKLDTLPGGQGSIVSKYGFILPLEALLEKRYLEFSHVIDYMILPAEDSMRYASPSGDYLVSLHRGDIKSISSTISEMMIYLERSNYTPEGSTYIIPLVDSWESSEEDAYITEILIPVAIKKE